jgi:hypothetical protein
MFGAHRFASLFHFNRKLVCGIGCAVLVLAVASTSRAEFCVVPDSAGTAALPPLGCEYTTPDGDMQIVDGLPAGTTIDIDAVLKDFFGVISGAGGNLGGERETYIGGLQLPMTGTGALAAFNRNMFMTVDTITDSAVRTLNDPVQTFARDMFSMSGEVIGDPDFQTLEIIAGTDMVAASSGSTTLKRLGGIGSDWNVESFFDVVYTITYVGAPGSALEEYSGVTTGTVRFQLGMPVPEPGSAMLCLVGLATLGLGTRRRRDG